MGTNRHGPFITPRDSLSTGLEALSTLSYHPTIPKRAASSWVQPNNLPT